MNEIELKLDRKGKGAFVIEEEEKVVAKMVIEIFGGNLTVYHTEVNRELRGRGLSGKLLDAMVGYARQHRLKVIALCPYVNAQFQRHPDNYSDIWLKNIRMKKP